MSSNASAEIWRNKGKDLLMAHHHEEALRAFEKAIELNPDDREAWHGKAEVLDELGCNKQAIEAYDRILELAPDDEKAFTKKNVILTHIFFYNKSLKGCYKDGMPSRNNAETWYDRGVFLLSIEHYDEALEAFDNATTLAPDDAKNWNKKGFALDRLNRKREAMQAFDKAIALNPDFIEAWVNKSKMIKNSGFYKTMTWELNKTIASYPNNPCAWYCNGLVLNSICRYEKAIIAFDKAIELNPNIPEIWFNKGIALMHPGKINLPIPYEKVLESFDQAIILDPNNPEYWAKKGVVLDEIHRYEEALAAADKAHALDPDYYGVTGYRDHLFEITRSDAERSKYKGFEFLRDHEYPKALDAYEKAIELNPNDTEAWHGKAEALDVLGCYEKAIEAYDRILKLSPEDSKAIMNNGILVYFMRIYKEASLNNNTLESNPYGVKVLFDTIWDPIMAGAWLSKGDTLCLLDRYEEALHIYDSVIDQLQGNRIAQLSNKRYVYIATIGRTALYIRALRGKGDAFSALKRYEDALEVYTRILKISHYGYRKWDRNWHRPWDWDYDDNVYYFEKKSEPDNYEIEAQRCIDNALFALQRYSEPLSGWNEIWKRESLYLWINYNRSKWHKKLDDLYTEPIYEKARTLSDEILSEVLKDYDEILSLDPDDEKARHCKGDVLYMLGRYKEAIKAYEAAIKAEPPIEDLPKYKDVYYDDDEQHDAYNYRDYIAHPWHGKANALYMLKRYDEAAAVWGEAMKRELYEEDGQGMAELIESFKDSLRRHKTY